jgi:hypothetical protein
VTAPEWVKITRVANTFTAYYSSKASTPAAGDWIKLGTPQTISNPPMGSAPFIGLGVCSKKDGQLSTAQFDSVAVTP